MDDVYLDDFIFSRPCVICAIENLIPHMLVDLCAVVLDTEEL